MMRRRSARNGTARAVAISSPRLMAAPSKTDVLASLTSGEPTAARSSSTASSMENSSVPWKTCINEKSVCR